MSSAKDIIFDKNYTDVIPYNLKFSRYNRNCVSIMKGYYYDEISDILLNHDETDPEQHNRFLRASRFKSVEKPFISVEKVYKEKLAYEDRNRYAAKRRNKIINWVSPCIKCHDEETNSLTYSYIRDIRFIGIMEVFKVTDWYDNIISTTLSTNLLTYSYGFKRFSNIFEGNLMAVYNCGEDKPLSGMITMIEKLGVDLSVYAVELERPTLHPIINGMIFKSVVFDKEEDNKDGN